MNTSSFGLALLVATQKCGTGAFNDRLFGQLLLAGRNRIGLDDGVVLVVQVEDIRRDSQANRITFAPVTVHYHPHNTLLEPDHTPRQEPIYW
jgi:hypothetical protein